MIEWNDKYRVGVSIIDEANRAFVDIINNADVIKQKSNKPEVILEILNEMTVYSLKSFTTEEAYMMKSNYTEYQSHKEKHMGFSDKTISFYNRRATGEYHMAEEILSYLKQWLFTHILSTDRKYIDCFEKNNLK